MNSICNKYLTDLDFIKHMIDHHQVAVDMSEQLKRVSNVPTMLELARNISYTQQYEIWIMKMMVSKGIPNISVDNSEFVKWNPNYTVGCYYPKMSKDDNTTCETHFFKSDRQMLAHINDINFLQHMIPHHQIAINMARRLLLHTKNPYLLEFVNEIIKNQQYEIWTMKETLSKLKTDSIPIQFHSQLF